MANVLTRTETVDNSGNPLATFGANNYKHVINQADVGREQIIKIAKTDITNAELSTIIQEITMAGGAGGTSDAFTVAAVGTATGAAFVSGTTDVVYLRVQGTGTYTPEGSDAHGVTGAVTTIEATFTPAL
jgi:hypothetical protein